jgi:type II pantothenate kinase
MSAPEESGNQIGLDLGATLAKAVIAVHGQSLTSFRTFVCRSDDRLAIASFLAVNSPGKVAVTGGGAQELLEGSAHHINRQDEFACWTEGSKMLLEKASSPVSDPFLLVSLGTGTSILAVYRHQDSFRAGGTAVGGGTLRGLGALVLGIDDFEELARLSREGDRKNIDLQVRDLYRPGGIALMPDLTASNFGRIRSSNPADIAAALQGLVGETVALLAGALGRALPGTSPQSALDVVFAGSTLRHNPVLEDVLLAVSSLMGLRARVLARGEFAAALGALSLSQRAEAH